MVHIKFTFLILAACLIIGSVKSEPQQNLLENNDGPLAEANKRIARVGNEDDKPNGDFDGSDEDDKPNGDFDGSDEDDKPNGDFDGSDESASGDDDDDFNELFEGNSLISHVKGRGLRRGHTIKRFNKFFGKSLAKSFINISKSRQCMFEPIVQSAKIVNTLAIRLFNLWKNYRAQYLPVFKSPRELAEMIESNRINYRALIKLAVGAVQPAIKAGFGLIKVMLRFIRCAWKVRERRPFIKTLKEIRAERREG